MIVISYYDGYVLDAPVQANDVLVLLIQQILLMFHSREEIEALQGQVVFLGGLAVMIVVAWFVLQHCK